MHLHKASQVEKIRIYLFSHNYTFYNTIIDLAQGSAYGIYISGGRGDGEVGRRIKKWMEEKKEGLAHLGKRGVNIKTWLTKQGFKLFKCTHPWIFYTMGPG